MKKLSIIDDAFLRIETRRQPFHIGVLLLFNVGEVAPHRYMEALVKKLRDSTSANEPFNRILRSKRGLHYWEEDSQFDITQQFAHVSLPAPGKIRQLLEFVSRVHSSHLDRAYPLWRLYLIEGIEDGRFAVYLKFHHSVMDGVAAVGLIVNAMSSDLEASKKLPAFWQSKVVKSGANTLPALTHREAFLKSLRSFSLGKITALNPLSNQVSGKLMRDYWQKHPGLVTFGQAPKTLFNQKISASRRIVAQSYSTARIRAIAKQLNASLNDVVLALCGSALRSYLDERNELPDKPLIAVIPVSTRAKGDPEFNNEISVTLTQLATHISDPIERVRQIKMGMDYNKQQMRDLTPGQTMTTVALKALPGISNSLLGFKPENSLASVCISHVPGPREDLYWQGAKLTGLYPVSLVTDGGALNITIISRHDFVDFGITACSKTVPRVQRLIDYLEDGLIELELALADQGVAASSTFRKDGIQFRSEAVESKDSTSNLETNPI